MSSHFRARIRFAATAVAASVLAVSSAALPHTIAEQAGAHASSFVFTARAVPPVVGLREGPIDGIRRLAPDDPPRCSGSATVCIKPGKSASHGWYLPQCANEPCGPEKWYTMGLPAGVTARFDPATTHNAQETLEKLHATRWTRPGTYTATVGASCNDGYCGSASYTIIVL